MSIGASRPDLVAEAQAPVLSVAGLTTSFPRERQWIPVVRDVSFDIAAKETVAIVGESGSGKSVTALSIMRLIPKESGRVEGRVTLAGRDLLTLSEASMTDVRGNDVAMIFQEPMTSLNPVLTIGFQIAEALILHRGLSRAAAEAETIRLLDRVRIPGGEVALPRVSASLLRRHAPARDDRDGARLQAEAADRRRADHRARRHHPGADPRASEGAPGARRACRSSSSPTTWAWSPRSRTAPW